MGAIFKKEFRTYFTTPIGCIVIAVMIFFASWVFVVGNIQSQSSDLTGVFSVFFEFSLFVLAFVTMRLFSEEKRQKTDQALLTSPVSLTGIVLGKFFAALLVFILSTAIIMVFAVIIAFQATPDWTVILGNFIGLFLVGGLVISIGMLISSLTESQVIAAIITLVVSVLILFMDQIASNSASIPLLTTVINFLSISQRYNSFTTGVIAYDDIIFFLSMQALVLFLTVRVLDSKRWS